MKLIIRKTLICIKIIIRIKIRISNYFKLLLSLDNKIMLIMLNQLKI